VPLQPVVDANESGSRSSVPFRERHDCIGRKSGDSLDTRRRVLTHAFAQLSLADRMCREKLAILEAALEEHMHHRQRQCGIGSRADREPLVTLRGGARAQRIDGDNRRSALAGAKHERPEVWIGRERIRAPEQHEVALWNSFRIGPDVRTNGHAHSDGACHRADRAIQHRRAEDVKEATIHRRTLNEAHRSRI
jgi:hypothetical protein